MENKNYKRLLVILRLACFTVFAGRAWQHLFWDAPFRTILWDESLMSGALAFFGADWFTYVTSSQTDLAIQVLTRGFGAFYLVLAVLSLYLTEKRSLGRVLLPAGAAALAVLAVLYCKEKFYHMAQFFEYALQVLSPVFLYILLYRREQFTYSRLLVFMRVGIATTFVAHGLYAVGFYPVPGVFVDMTINSLGVTEDTALVFLKAAGIMDLVLGLALFVPVTARVSLFYCVCWGFLTALARTWANVDADGMAAMALHQYLPQTIYRLPHFLIPLAALYLHSLQSDPGIFLRTFTYGERAS